MKCSKIILVLSLISNYLFGQISTDTNGNEMKYKLFENLDANCQTAILFRTNKIYGLFDLSLGKKEIKELSERCRRDIPSKDKELILTKVELNNLVRILEDSINFTSSYRIGDTIYQDGYKECFEGTHILLINNKFHSVIAGFIFSPTCNNFFYLDSASDKGYVIWQNSRGMQEINKIISKNSLLMDEH